MNSTEPFEKKIAILQEITNTMAATENIKMVADLMLELAIDYTNAEKGSLMLLNDQDELTIFTERGIDSHLARTYRVKLGEGIAGHIAKHRLPVLVEDIEKDKRFEGNQSDRYKTRSFISCPIVCKNKLLGILNINDKTDHTPFTEDEFTLIKIISNQAAIALENAFLVNQLKTKASEFEEINRKLIELDVMKTEFLVRVSHELRTPLNSINGSIYHLRTSEHISKSEQKDFYDIITNETDNLIHIVEKMLDFLRLEDESRVLKKSVISLADIFSSISRASSLKMFLSKKNLQLNVNIPKNTSDLVGDKTSVSQLFINMIEGLSYNLQKDDSIDINVHQDDFIHVVLLCSREIPDELFPSLFQPKNLFQTEYSEESIKLYLANKVIESHNWNMLKKNTDKGFCLEVIIPKSTRQKVDAVVSSTMDMFIDFISDMMDVSICSIMLGDDFTGDLTIKSARGINDDVINKTRIKVGDSISGWVALQGKPLFIEDIETDQRFMRKNINNYDTKSLISVPIKIHDKVIGVINLNNKKTKTNFTMLDFFTASVLSERVSFFFERLYAGDLDGVALKQFTTSFDNLLSIGKKYRKKGGPYAPLMLKIMDRLGTTEEEKKIAVYTSMIYDLGLVQIEENITITKRRELTPAEAQTFKVHPYTTVSLLDDFEFSDEVKNAILHHHERYDGKGYPKGLKGNEIPFISRILHVVDAYCAITTERPYRHARSQGDALTEIKKYAGSMYDPSVVQALEDALLTA